MNAFDLDLAFESLAIVMATWCTALVLWWSVLAVAEAIAARTAVVATCLGLLRNKTAAN